MGLRSLIVTLIAMTMAFAPVASFGGTASAASSPADHHAQMMESGHCDEQPGGELEGQAGDQSCCVATCAAIGINPQPAQDFTLPSSSMRRASPSQFQLGYSAELPTPPPRLA